MIKISLSAGKDATTSFRVDIPLINKTFGINLMFTNTPNVDSGGWTSRNKDGLHTLFFDWDGLTLDECMDEAKSLIECFSLSDFYIFENDREDSFLGVCLDLFSLKDAFKIVSSSNCDMAFKRAPMAYRKKRWVLRCLKKGERDRPRFRCGISSPFNERMTSRAHRVLLESAFDITVRPHLLDNEDGHKTLDWCSYVTGNRVKKVKE